MYRRHYIILRAFDTGNHLFWETASRTDDLVPRRLAGTQPPTQLNAQYVAHNVSTLAAKPPVIDDRGSGAIDSSGYLEARCNLHWCGCLLWRLSIKATPRLAATRQDH